MELLRSPSVVGQKQEPDRRLRDEQRLREDERVRDERATTASTAVRNEPEDGGRDTDDDDGDPDRDVQSEHRAHPSEHVTLGFVTQVTRVTAVLAVIAVLVLASCGGSDGSMRATLTDHDCTYRGDKTAAAGRFSIEVENRTLRFARFGLISLGDTTSIEDVDLFHQSLTSRRLARSRAVPDVPPPFGGWVVGAEVGPSSGTSLPVDTSAGRYAVVCYVQPNSEERLSTDAYPRPDRAYTATQLDVTGMPSYPGVND